MAIRIRLIEGCTVALCAAVTEAQKNDTYLDDDEHHALTTKFGVDWKKEGFLDEDMADPVIKDLMLREEERGH